MNKVLLKPYNVIADEDLPETSFDDMPGEGDAIEIQGELYFVCEPKNLQKEDSLTIGVIPLVVRNPAKIPNIKEYIECLSIAHRKVLFKNSEGICDLDHCDEMIIT